MSKNENRTIDFGAVYYRYSAPLERDWEEDYKKAAEDGITQFRHWVPWGAVETSPGEFCWEPYDKLVALGDKYGIKTVLAEMSTMPPDWFYAAHEDARLEDRCGSKRLNRMCDSCMAGGIQSMCMDHKSVRDGVAGFLRAMGEHYRGSAGLLLGYDVWNECSLYTFRDLCYCKATEEEFQEWLRKKYGTLERLHEVWGRHSYTDWSQIRLPRLTGPHPEFLDMLRFQGDQQERWFRYRIDVLREADPNHKIIAHGNAKDHLDIAPCCGDDWRYAKHPDIFGYTLWYENRCTALMGGDMIRLASDGKEFWRAEAIGDATWEHRSDKAEYKPGKDTMSLPENIRMDALMSIGTGASAFINPRYRGLYSGHLFHAYGWCAPDGSRTDRSEEIRRLAKWCHDEKTSGLWQARPVRGQVGLLLLEDAQALCFSLYDETEIYADCLRGSYQAFTDSGIQADIIRMPQIDAYDLLYVPYPAAISDQDMETLKNWIARGGTMISEGCFGYFDDYGHAIETSQPNRGFAEVFGCVQSSVHLGPDRNREMDIVTGCGQIPGGVYCQSYQVTEGTAEGRYEDGRTAIVSHAYGKGRAVLVGSMPGYGYYHRPDERGRRWFASLLEYAGKKPLAVCPYNLDVTVRFWEQGTESYVWIFNFADQEQCVTVNLRDEIAEPLLLRGLELAEAKSDRITVRIGPKDAAVLRIN